MKKHDTIDRALHGPFIQALQRVGLGLVLAFGAMTLRAQDAVPTAVSPPPSVTTNATSDSGTAESNPERGPLFSLGLQGGYLRPFNGDYEHFTEAMLTGEYEVNPFQSVSVSIGVGAFELKGGSDADLIAHRPGFGAVTVAGRQYFAPAKTLLRPYLTAGVGWMFMDWDYRNVVNGNKSDSMNGISGFAGVGLYVGLRKFGRLFGEFDCGGVAFEGTTNGGVKNSMFSNFGYAGVRAGFAISF